MSTGSSAIYFQRVATTILAAQVVAMLTQTEVDPADPAFSHPTKFIGPATP